MSFLLEFLPIIIYILLIIILIIGIILAIKCLITLDKVEKVVDNVDEIDINKYGPAIEAHEVFPEKINVHFVEVISKNEGKMITWERGAGVTLACGTGATSTAISGFKLGLFDSDVLLHLPGGDLKFNVYEKDDELLEYIRTTAKKFMIHLFGFSPF